MSMGWTMIEDPEGDEGGVGDSETGVATRTRPHDGRDVTTYAITDEGRAALRAWMEETPAGFPVLKHPVLLRLLVGHVSDPARIEEMLAEYAAQARRAREELADVREGLRGADGPGEAFHHPSLVADWGLDYFADEARNAERALARLRTEAGGSEVRDDRP